MSPRRLASVAALVSLVSGVAGIIAPATLASLVGLTLDPTGQGLARLACASYLGYAALNWFARGVTDGTAWRAIGGANAVAWAFGAGVSVLAFVSGIGDARLLAMVAIQIVFALLWSAAALERPAVVSRAGAAR